MGMIQCPKHGIQGISLVCPHIYAAHISGTAFPEMLAVTADLDHDNLKMKARLCTACAENAVSDDGGFDRLGDQGLDWFFDLKLDPVCTICLNEVQCDK